MLCNFSTDLTIFLENSHETLKIDLKRSVPIWSVFNTANCPKSIQTSNSVPEKWLTAQIIYNDFDSAAPVGSLQRHAIL